MPRKPLSQITKIEFGSLMSRFSIPSVFVTSKSRSGLSNRRGMLAEEFRIRRK